MVASFPGSSLCVRRRKTWPSILFVAVHAGGGGGGGGLGKMLGIQHSGMNSLVECSLRQHYTFTVRVPLTLTVKV